MKSMIVTTATAALLAGGLALSPVEIAYASGVDSSIAACLKTWGEHPFGANPQYRTLGVSFTLFGIGNEANDTAATKEPALVLVEPSVNLVGLSRMNLMNPNGWYCVRTAVSIVGNVTVRAHCKAQLAGHSDGLTIRGNKGENRGFKDLSVTVLGRMDVERPCDQ